MEQLACEASTCPLLTPYILAAAGPYLSGRSLLSCWQGRREKEPLDVAGGGVKYHDESQHFYSRGIPKREENRGKAKT